MSITVFEISSAHTEPPQDLCVAAPTGSGKTLCYVLPVIEKLKCRHVKRIRCLIVVPVVNLAKQVLDIVRLYSKGTDLKSVLLTGKQSFEAECAELYDTVLTVRGSIQIATADIVRNFCILFIAVAQVLQFASV